MKKNDVIGVVVRVRPVLENEKAEKLVWMSDSRERSIKTTTGSAKHSYTFGKYFCQLK